jgi:hypothetical protein
MDGQCSGTMETIESLPGLKTSVLRDQLAASASLFGRCLEQEGCGNVGFIYLALQGLWAEVRLRD